MNKRRGFTLIELLVVISIIALLMSIMMPALARVKKQAQGIRCQATLKQWGVIFAMYSNDNAQKITTKTLKDGYWFTATRPYVNTMVQNGQAAENDMYFCPLASKLPPANASPVAMRDPQFRAYQYVESGVTYTASYAFNAWLYDYGGSGSYQDRPGESMWRTLSMRGASEVPMLSEGLHGGGCPTEGDTPPQITGDVWQSGHNNEMGRFCLDRHQGFANSLFVDSSIRRVGLKQLWTLKWNRNFNVNGPWTSKGGVLQSDWPDWMQQYKDY